MDLYSSWQKLKTYTLKNQNIFLRVPFCFALQLAIFFDKRVNDSDEDKKPTYELAAIASGLVGMTGLMTNLAYLQNFYLWLFEQVVLLMAFLAIATYGPGEVESEISSASASSSYLSGILGYTLLYTQVFVAVSIAIVPRKWTSVSARQTIAAFIVFPLVLQLLTFPFSGKASLILRDVCLAYLLLASAIQLFKGFVGILQLLRDMPGVMKNSCNLVYNFGWMEFFSYHWRRTGLARVLMIAWLIKFTAKITLYLQTGLSNTLAGSLVECFDSILDLAGVSVLVGVSGRMTLDFVKTFLQQNQEQPAEDRHQETWTGISFFLLGMQAGIVNHQKHQERLLLIGLVIFVTLSFFLQSAYELTEPVLMSLGATYTGIISGKHLRTLAVCIVILIVPGFMIVFLCQMFSFDAWLFVIISSNLVTIVQVMGSLTIYSLFVSNVHSETRVKDLDDHIYYINAGSKVFEFVVAVVILPYTAWATLNGHWNYLGAAVISLHAYFNVYKRAQEGWKNFLLRRSAVKRLNSLQWATDEQLRNLDDVCCICYEVLDKAKVTKCNHYFHSLCLRKWLYVQDMCPMCHANILPTD